MLDGLVHVRKVLFCEEIILEDQEEEYDDDENRHAVRHSEQSFLFSGAGAEINDDDSDSVEGVEHD